MKLRYIAYSALLALVAAGTSSCEDFLSKNPDERMELDTPEKMQMLLVSGYTQGNYALLGELSSDNFVDNNAPNASGQRYNLGEFERMDNEIFAWEPVVSSDQQDSPSNNWQGCYHAIACANQVLQRVAELEAEGRGNEVSAIKGEALLIRAYHHFLLANLFCMPYAGPEASRALQGIPYSTEPETTLNVVYDRGNLADTYDKIEADLLAGLPLINDEIYDQPKYHFNSTAANAFAARFYLFKREYDKCIQYADAALGTTAAPPMSMFNDIWANTFSAPELIGQYWISVERQCNFMLIATVSNYALRPGNRYAINGDALNATLQSSGPTWSGQHPCYSGKVYISVSQEYGSFFPNYYGLFEFTDKVAQIGYWRVVRTEFTTEETVLCRAEAKFYTGDIEGGVADLKAWDDSRQINTTTTVQPPLTKELILGFYRDRDPGYGIVKPLHIDEVCPSSKYKVTPDIEPYLQCVLHYRRLNNLGDGSRWFDIKRYGLELTHAIGASRVETLTVNDARRAFQLPSDVISAGMEPTFRPSNAGDEIFLQPLPEKPYEITEIEKK